MSAAQKMAVHQETHIQASPSVVWEKMTSVDGMKNWLGPSEYQPQQGAKIDFHVNHDGGKYYMFGEVVTFNPPKELAFTWTEQPVGGEAWPVPTLVTLTLTPEDGGTRVRLVHSGFENLPGAIAETEFKGYTAGWEMRHTLDGLKEFVEQK